jgi:hypothetical protein
LYHCELSSHVKGIIRSCQAKEDREYKEQRTKITKDKQLWTKKNYTKYYFEQNELKKTQGWTQVLRKGKLFLVMILFYDQTGPEWSNVRGSCFLVTILTLLVYIRDPIPISSVTVSGQLLKDGSVSPEWSLYLDGSLNKSGIHHIAYKLVKGKFDITKGVSRGRESKKDRQHNESKRKGVSRGRESKKDRRHNV